MACGSCSGVQSNSEYLVTFGDGTEKRAATAGEARILARMDTTGSSKAPMIRMVPKIAKTP